MNRPPRDGGAWHPRSAPAAVGPCLSPAVGVDGVPAVTRGCARLVHWLPLPRRHSTALTAGQRGLIYRSLGPIVQPSVSWGVGVVARTVNFIQPAREPVVWARVLAKVLHAPPRELGEVEKRGGKERWGDCLKSLFSINEHGRMKRKRSFLEFRSRITLGIVKAFTPPGLLRHVSTRRRSAPENNRLTLNLAALDVVADRLGAPAVDLAAGGECSAQHLLDRTLERLGHGLVPQRAGDLDDLVQRDALGVLDVLLLLAVARRLLERLDDQRGGRRDDGHSGLTVLDGEPDGHAQTFLLRRGMCGRERTQSPVALAISSPTFLGDRPRGPILGASADEAPTSPPVARRDDTYAWLVRKVVGRFEAGIVLSKWVPKQKLQERSINICRADVGAEDAVSWPVVMQGKYRCTS
ncbi:hypothetical protein FH972_023738 [Carpinus fangiana]|uniref:Uncharacterized protein n=1 Tax=Carpinus fangiana TaxID=176857 RepID=A0A5N6KWU6_9ROSI|nr:hypothetical protein FH972_023738 [Carpinus fangiana]